MVAGSSPARSANLFFLGIFFVSYAKVGSDIAARIEHYQMLVLQNNKSGSIEILDGDTLVQDLDVYVTVHARKQKLFERLAICSFIGIIASFFALAMLDFTNQAHAHLARPLFYLSGLFLLLFLPLDHMQATHAEPLIKTEPVAINKYVRKVRTANVKRLIKHMRSSMR